MAYSADRTGHGRWCTVLAPHPGILWTDDHDALGFQAVGKIATDDGIADYDGHDLHTVIDALAAAGMTATAAFDTLAALHGRDLKAGELDTWRPDRNRARPDLGELPPLQSTAQVMDEL